MMDSIRDQNGVSDCIDKSIKKYPIMIEHNPVDGDDVGLCPSCKKGKVYCSWGHRAEECPECGQKITWFKY